MAGISISCYLATACRGGEAVHIGSLSLTYSTNTNTNTSNTLIFFPTHLCKSIKNPFTPLQPSHRSVHYSSHSSREPCLFCSSYKKNHRHCLVISLPLKTQPALFLTATSISCLTAHTKTAHSTVVVCTVAISGQVHKIKSLFFPPIC